MTRTLLAALVLTACSPTTAPTPVDTPADRVSGDRAHPIQEPRHAE